jgi:hypothetical protein
MNHPIFPQNVIAVIWDFDKTLIPGNMQRPLFRHFDIDETGFWEEVDGLETWYCNHGNPLISRDTLYLNHLLTYVQEGLMPGLSNALLRELGAEIEFYQGMPEFMGLMRKHIESDARFVEHQVHVEHYVVSTGLRQMILGSAVAPFVTDVWASEFTEQVAPPGYADGQDRLFSPEGEIRQLIYTIDNTTKTRAIFEINKGSNKNPGIDVNAKVAPEDRRVPFQNMIYIADGPPTCRCSRWSTPTVAVLTPSTARDRCRSFARPTACWSRTASTPSERPTIRKRRTPPCGSPTPPSRSPAASWRTARTPSLPGSASPHATSPKTDSSSRKSEAGSRKPERRLGGETGSAAPVLLSRRSGGQRSDFST